MALYHDEARANADAMMLDHAELWPLGQVLPLKRAAEMDPNIGFCLADGLWPWKVIIFCEAFPVVFQTLNVAALLGMINQDTPLAGLDYREYPSVRAALDDGWTVD